MPVAALSGSPVGASAAIRLGASLLADNFVVGGGSSKPNAVEQAAQQKKLICARK